jgi:hypothetical protein
LFALVAVCVGCADDPYDPGAPAIDRNAPRVEIVSPARGTIAGDVTHVLVTGRASDDSGTVASVTVNGVPAVLGDDGTWAADVTVVPGTSLLRAIALDGDGNQSQQTRAVVTGPLAELDGRIERGITATLSAPALLALGHRTAAFIEAGGLMTAAQSMNPVVDVGGGPDCLYGQASITSLSVGNAEVLMGPTAEGILVSAVLDDVRVGMHLQWAVSCVEGSRDVLMSARRVTVQGLLTIGVVDRKLDVRFAEPNVQVTGFDPQLSDVPEPVVQMLGLDSAISQILGSVTERFVLPMAKQSLAALDQTRTVDVAGVRIDVDAEPTQISFGPQGGTIVLATSLRARGDHGAFVFVPNSVPALDAKHGFELAIADDAANQLLASLWSANAFDTTLELAANEQLGALYDSVQLELMVPPHVNASTRPLELTFGDWIATFRQRGVAAASVAIHAKTALYVAEDDDGKLRLRVSTPAVTADLVGNGNSITRAQYDAIKAFGSERVTALGSAALAAIPLPTVGDATPANPWVEPDLGFMLVAGDIE